MLRSSSSGKTTTWVAKQTISHFITLPLSSVTSNILKEPNINAPHWDHLQTQMHKHS